MEVTHFIHKKLNYDLRKHTLYYLNKSFTDTLTTVRDMSRFFVFFQYKVLANIKNGHLL